MSLFEDKKYSEMDWLAKAVEPVLSTANELLAKLPDEFCLEKDDIWRMMSKSHYEIKLHITDVFAHMLYKSKVHIEPGNVHGDILKCYVMHLEGDLAYVGDDRPHLEGEGRIKLIKCKKMFEEEELQKKLGKEGLHKLSRISVHRVTTERINEMLELIEGTEKIRSSKSINKKVDGLKEALSKIMEENKWNIKDLQLADRVFDWIIAFLETGNLAAMANFCKLKVMTHHSGNAAIYSIDEEII